MTLLRTLLITYPLTPISLVDHLRTLFPVVHFYPGVAGNDYNATASVLPTSEVFASADVLLTFGLPTNLKHWSQTPNLKLLQCVGAGVNQITDTAYWESVPDSSPVVLANSTGIHVPAISEHVMMTVMALYHKLLESTDIARNEKRWAAPKELGGMFIQEIRGQTFGILGYGHLGRQVARLATAFGANVLACTREGRPKRIGGYLLPNTGDIDGSLPSAYFTTGSKETLHDFLGRCDVVVMALPSSKETKQFLGRDEFMAMKDSAIFVNIGRGDTIDQDALVEALQATGPRTNEPGTLSIGGASIDVTTPEPLPPNHPLFSTPNTILTPHVSWASKLNFVRAVEVLEMNQARMEKGEGALNALRGKGEDVLQQ